MRPSGPKQTEGNLKSMLGRWKSLSIGVDEAIEGEERYSIGTGR